MVRRRRSRGDPQEKGAAEHSGADISCRRKGRDAIVTQPDPKITPELVQEHNLTTEKYERITAMLDRIPTFPELGIFSAQWSEHCSSKHSRPILKPIQRPRHQAVQGPGEK